MAQPRPTAPTRGTPASPRRPGLAARLGVLLLTLLCLLGTTPAQADPACAAYATGGTVTRITVDSQQFCIHTFTTVGTHDFELLRSRSVEYLLVGGGGGGGALAGGGGGAGGVRNGFFSEVRPFTIEVGAGGVGDFRTTWPNAPVPGGGNGTRSGIFSAGFSDQAAGGGGGGTYNNQTLNGAGRNGGSGGGASHVGAPGSGTGGQGNSGATGTIGGGDSSGGGGGGAGQAGFAGTSSQAGRGGNGVSSSISGSSVTYGGGGAGGGDLRWPGVSTNSGGAGGGGESRNDVAAGNNGLNGRGGGGAGGRIGNEGLESRGGNGGSGIVILRYVYEPVPTADAGPDQTVYETTPVTLDASGSSASGGEALSYAWAQIEGPAVTLSGANTATPGFTAPSGPATLRFRVTVTSSGQTDTDEVTITVAALPDPPQPGTGVSVTEYNDIPGHVTWRAQSFFGDGTLVLSAPTTLDYLIVGGGGGGGGIAEGPSGGAGGGGAGGMLEGTRSVAAGSFSITVGQAGAGAICGATCTAGTNGGASSFDGLIALGGGRGSFVGNSSGAAGGSGGGGRLTSSGGGGAGTPSQGNSGGTGDGDATFNVAGAGGGGAGAPGGSVMSNSGADGGAGQISGITGTDQVYAGGGGGGGFDGATGGSGGTGGGGGAPATRGPGQNATAGTGGGGGGASGSFSGDGFSGGHGGSGIVVLRYVINTGPTADAGPAQSVTGFTQVSLDGTGSSDPDGDALIYEWEQIAGTTVALSDPASTAPGFTAPQPVNGISEDLTFRLTVTDPFGLVSTSEVTITVTPRTETQPPPPGAGGTVVEYNDIAGHVTWRAHSYFGNGTLSLSDPTEVEYLIVAGGGGGGNSGTSPDPLLNFSAGGGGAGGLLVGTETLTAGSYPAIIGTGGQGGNQALGLAAQNGTDSSFAGQTALGGGGGGGAIAGTPRVGGSGGGGRARVNSQTTVGAAGTPGQGHAGGAGNGHGSTLTNRAGGGGGGAGGPGVNGENRVAGAGGAGITSAITGSLRGYGGGGGGGMIANADTVGAASHGGGSGGGGAGAALPGDGQPNTGGGGGGAGFGRDAGGNGGSGIVVARYVINTGPEANAGADVTATEGQEITLLGTASDPDDNITSISWTQTAGTTVTLTDANILQPGFTATAPAGGAASEDLVFQITVTDAFGLVTTDSVTITLQGQAELSVTKTVRVFSESGSACDDLTAAPPDTGSLPATAIPGACMEYTITITNTGPVAAEQITLRDELPADLTLSAAELRPDWAEGTLTLSPDCPGAGCVIEVEGGRIAAGATARVIIRAVLR